MLFTTVSSSDDLFFWKGMRITFNSLRNDGSKIYYRKGVWLDQMSDYI